MLVSVGNSNIDMPQLTSEAYFYFLRCIYYSYAKTYCVDIQDVLV